MTTTRHPCGCGIAWLRHGGHQDAAETRAPPVFRRHSANERAGWLLCSAHLRALVAALALTACTSSPTGPLPKGWSGPFLCHSGVAGADYHRDGVSMVCVSSDGQWQWRRVLPRPSQPPRSAS